jgi:ADP-heptose:LPS heptosyltransferase
MAKNQNNLNGKTVVISRTDSIGDVILTLPICSWLKETFPDCKLIFLGKKYTKPILECFPAIDELQFWDEIQDQPEQGIISTLKSWEVDVFVHVFPNKRIAKLVRKAKIPMRVGTSHRGYHLLTCNNRPSFTRKKSDLHESQLNFKLFEAFGLKDVPDLDMINQWVSAFKSKTSLPEVLLELLNTEQKKIILHPKSQGSAVEWPLEKYTELATRLVDQNYRVYFSGTEKEGLLFREQLPKDQNIIDISGKMSLSEFISFINEVDGLIACSTGPLHIAAVLQKRAIGLYTNVRPMHPGRWAPIGTKSETIVSLTESTSPEKEIRSITVDQLIEKL